MIPHGASRAAVANVCKNQGIALAAEPGLEATWGSWGGLRCRRRSRETWNILFTGGGIGSSRVGGVGGGVGIQGGVDRGVTNGWGVAANAACLRAWAWPLVLASETGWALDSSRLDALGEEVQPLCLAIHSITDHSSRIEIYAYSLNKQTNTTSSPPRSGRWACLGPQGRRGRRGRGRSGWSTPRAPSTCSRRAP